MYAALRTWWCARRLPPVWAAGGSVRGAGTLLDAADATSVVRLVRLLSSHDGGADELADRLTRLFAHLPPDEYLMRRLSLLHQRQGDGGEADFCVALVYMTATESLLRGHSTTTTRRRFSRARSWPLVRPPAARPTRSWSPSPVATARTAARPRAPPSRW